MRWDFMACTDPSASMDPRYTQKLLVSGPLHKKSPTARLPQPQAAAAGKTCEPNVGRLVAEQKTDRASWHIPNLGARAAKNSHGGVILWPLVCRPGLAETTDFGFRLPGGSAEACLQALARSWRPAAVSAGNVTVQSAHRQPSPLGCSS